MALKLVGIIDFNGQAHCLDHASTVASYRDEVYSVDPARECWCGKVVAGQIPSPASFIRMNDGMKGGRAPARRTVAKGRKR